MVAGQQAADRADGFFDRFAERRFGAGGAVDDAFGDAGDAAFVQRPAQGRFVDALDGFVDGSGDRAGGRAGAAAAPTAGVAAA